MSSRHRIRLKAPRYGAVIDYNIFDVPDWIPDQIVADVARADTDAFCHRYKLIVSAIDLQEYTDGCHLTLELCDGKGTLCYEMPNVLVEKSVGGLAYNVLQNLIVLNEALCGPVELDAQIGVPREHWGDDGGSHFIDAKPRNSVMIRRAGRQELNIVSKGARLLNSPGGGPQFCDSIILSSHPVGEYEEEIRFCTMAKASNPSLLVYFSPGSTQIRKGISPLVEILPFTKLIVMKLDEALALLRINHKSSRDRLAVESLNQLLSFGADTIVLNDSENGSYCGTPNRFLHLPPYKGIVPKALIGNESRRSNYSGCGDGIFASLVYRLCIGFLGNTPTNLLFATAVAHVIGVRYDSNLRDVSRAGIRELWTICEETRFAPRRIYESSGTRISLEE